MTKSNEEIKDALSFIDVADLSYQEWVNVGFALKDAGLDCSVWDEWSKDDLRYKPGECERKWNTFNGSSDPVTSATIMKMAYENGYQSPSADYALDWDSEIGGKRDGVIVDKNWIEDRELHEPADFNPVKEISTYLETLFDSNDYVGFVTETWEKDGKFMPNKGVYTKTAGSLLQELSHCKGDIGSVLGDTNEEAGAWIRFNPLDGKGVKNENVTDFRYALVESDEMSIEKQNALIRELELPVAVLVHSGGKSLHAIIKIDAADYNIYRQRVDYLYAVCLKNGLKIDRQNRNPSRLSRLPGVMRKGKKQYIVDTNIGKSSFDEWKEWIESVTDDLPDMESLSDVWDNMPELSPPLIDGILRQGHKMLIAGPSKAGKSYALIELCIALAEGTDWLGYKCAQGRVLYVNLELDRASCLHRFKDVYTALHLSPDNLDKIDIWNLRGRSVPMDKLAPKLIRRASKKDYAAIIIDPIYKVITGDENSADQMASFCNQFDKVCTELSCAVIYCHHHSKGAQGGKRSMDRASGSGVFARDPDALLDLIELDVSDSLKEQEQNEIQREICCEWCNRWFGDKWQDEISEDDMCNAKTMRDFCLKSLPSAAYKNMMSEIDKVTKAALSRTAWRIECTLREFPKPPELNLWFDYPVHRRDECDKLKDLQADGESVYKAQNARKESAKSKRDETKEKLENAIKYCDKEGENPTVKEIHSYLVDKKGKPAKETVRRWVNKYGYRIDKNNNQVIKRD